MQWWDDRGAALTLGLSGVLGFGIGCVLFPTWHVAVETAQVVGGIVTYPPDNLFYLYHARVWTVLHQILALALRAGLTERALSEFLSGLVGMVSFQALAMTVYAFSRSVTLAIGAAFVIFFSQAADFGAVYPIWLMNTQHTYGVIGLSTLVLALALVGCGWLRSGGFLLGLMPAVHPSLGAWLLAILAVAIVLFRRELISALRSARPWFVAGAAVTAASLAVHMIQAWGVPLGETEPARPYLLAFIELWDGHRRPVPLDSHGAWLNLGVLAIALLWIVAWSGDLPRAAVSLLRIVVAAVLVALACALVTWVPAERLPMPLVVLMPGRVMNVAAFVFAALVFGLIGSYRHRMWSQLLIAAAMAALLFSGNSQLWGALRGVGWAVSPAGYSTFLVITAAAVALVVCAVMDAWIRTKASTENESRPPRIVVAVSIARTAALAVFVSWILPLMVDPTPFLRDLRYRDRVRDHVYAAAAEGKGLLATGADLHLIQLRTRRPVLIDGGGLDGLAYAADAGPGLARLLADVYGVDFFNPPEGRGRGTIPRNTSRVAWEGYSRERWTDIKRRYGVTEVVTFIDWRLDLPLVAESWDLRLYRIP